MVKAIAEEQGIPMPSFAATCCGRVWFLVPIFVLVTLVLLLAG